jgi:hypothetical protein
LGGRKFDASILLLDREMMNEHENQLKQANPQKKCESTSNTHQQQWTENPRNLPQIIISDKF